MERCAIRITVLQDKETGASSNKNVGVRMQRAFVLEVQRWSEPHKSTKERAFVRVVVGGPTSKSNRRWRVFKSIGHRNRRPTLLVFISSTFVSIGVHFRPRDESLRSVCGLMPKILRNFP